VPHPKQKSACATAVHFQSRLPEHGIKALSDFVTACRHGMQRITSHQSPTSRLDKDFGLPLRTSCVFTAVRLATVGRRAFSVAGARVWNALPVDVTSAPSLFTFRKRLKLYLFSLSYDGLVY